MRSEKSANAASPFRSPKNFVRVCVLSELAQNLKAAEWDER
jgi:hypothetical protein